jgi:hypothetical protein
MKRKRTDYVVTITIVTIMVIGLFVGIIALITILNTQKSNNTIIPTQAVLPQQTQNDIDEREVSSLVLERAIIACNRAERDAAVEWDQGRYDYCLDYTIKSYLDTNDSN